GPTVFGVRDAEAVVIRDGTARPCAGEDAAARDEAKVAHRLIEALGPDGVLLLGHFGRRDRRCDAAPHLLRSSLPDYSVPILQNIAVQKDPLLKVGPRRYGLTSIGCWCRKERDGHRRLPPQMCRLRLRRASRGRPASGRSGDAS